jgi:hypothetical protein
MLHRAKLGAALLTVGMTMAIIPITTASATVAKSSVCKAYSAEEAKQLKASDGLEKDIASGNWASAKKAMLSTFTSEASAEKQFAAYLNGASAKVKAAAAVALKLDNSFKTIISNSSSLTQFESGITAAESTPKVTAALKVLDAYSAKLCGTTTPTT